MQSEDVKHILKKQDEAIEEDNDELVLRFSEQFQCQDNDEDITRCKIISLIKLKKFEQALQIQKLLKTKNEDHAFLKGYLSYKLGRYKETIDILDKSNFNGMKSKILLAQTYNKIENFEKSIQLYVELLLYFQEQLGEDYEDICANYLNSMSWMLWIKKSEGKETIEQSHLEKSALKEVSQYLIDNKEKITYREIYLNFCILLAVSNGVLLGLDNETEVRDFMLKAFYDKLNEDKEDEMDEEPLPGNDNDLDEKGKDLVISKILEGLFMEKDKCIQYKEQELENVEKSLNCMEKADIFLKISTLSFLIFMKTNNESTSGLHSMTKEIDKLLEQLKRENLSQKLKKVLTDNLIFNKIITLLYRNKYSDAGPLINSMNINSDNYIMRYFTALKTKNAKDMEKLSNDQTYLSRIQHGQVLASFLQLSAYSQLNNQKKYIDAFKDFFKRYFLDEQKKPAHSRFCSESSYAVFSRALIQRIFKNSTLLNELKGHFNEIIEYINDNKMLHKIAENFAKKNDIEVAHNIYRNLCEKFPEDVKAQRKYLFYQAFKDTSSVQADQLPDLDLVSDYNKLRSIEMDYLQYKGASTAQRPTSNYSFF